jgi:hypothetical protein
VSRITRRRCGCVVRHKNYDFYAAAFIHPFLLAVAKQSLFYGCLPPGSHRLWRGSVYCSKLTAKKLADSNPKIICVLIDVHGVPLTEDIH